jgi:hypothetical protein
MGDCATSSGSETARKLLLGNLFSLVADPNSGVTWKWKNQIQNATYVGYTVRGQGCATPGNRPSTFEVLACVSNAVYSVLINDKWPVPKGQVWYPGLPHKLVKKKKWI